MHKTCIKYIILRNKNNVCRKKPTVPFSCACLFLWAIHPFWSLVFLYGKIML